jgi:hypothetical protein
MIDRSQNIENIEHRGLVKIMVDRFSNVNTARKDFGVFLNGFQWKGTSTDIIFCILYGAVNIFESIVL